VERSGTINSDLTAGVDVTAVIPLKSNEGVCSPGVKLHGAGFIVTPQEAAHLGLGKRAGLEKHIREYRNGRDLMARPRGVLVIDLFGLDSDQVRRRFPEVYQHVVLKVKENKDADGNPIGRDANKRGYRRENCWLFGENNPDLRRALNGLPRYVVTVETSKHRVFPFLSRDILPDNKLITIGSDDAFVLGILSSHLHVTWALRAGGWLGVGNNPVYVKSRCFDPFPFPEADDVQQQRVRVIAEGLDAHRKPRPRRSPAPDVDIPLQCARKGACQRETGHAEAVRPAHFRRRSRADPERTSCRQRLWLACRFG
jgi:hypothetical protein